MSIRRDLKIGIISSLTASFLLLFLQPILASVWKLIKDISINSYTGYINTIYKTAAQGQNEKLTFLIFYMLFLGLFGLVIRTTFKLDSYKKAISTSHKFKDSEIKLDDISVSDKVSNVKQTLIVSYLLLPLTGILALGLFFNLFVSVELNTSFNQRLNAILPYIDNSTERKIKSEWALMKNVEDFERIDSQISSIGIKSKIVLPQNLLN